MSVALQSIEPFNLTVCFCVKERWGIWSKHWGQPLRPLQPLRPASLTKTNLNFFLSFVPSAEVGWVLHLPVFRLQLTFPFRNGVYVCVGGGGKQATARKRLFPEIKQSFNEFWDGQVVSTQLDTFESCLLLVQHWSNTWYISVENCIDYVIAFSCYCNFYHTRITKAIYKPIIWLLM